MLDLSINLGNLLTIASFLVGGTTFIVALRSMLRSLDERMVSVEGEIKKLTDILVKLAAYDERFKNYDERFLRNEADVARLHEWFDELRHGEGLVVATKRAAKIRRDTAVRSP